MSIPLPVRRRRVALGVATAVLAVLAILWIGRGVALHASDGRDLAARHREVHLLLDGIDPNAVTAPAAAADAPVVGVYPPWSYVLTAPLLWPASAGLVTGLWFAAWFACLGAMLRHAWRLSRDAGPRVASFAAVSVAALAPLMNDLRSGNWALMCTALLWGALACLERGRPKRAGLLIGLAAIKPHVALPFGLCLLVRRARWGGAAVALGVPGVASAVHWALTGVDPVTSLRASRGHDAGFVSRAGGLPQALDAAMGQWSPLAQYGLSAALLGLGAACLWRLRRAEPLAQFALAAIVSATWTYHRSYDHAVLGFALVWLALSLARSVDEGGPGRARRPPGATPALGAALLALGLSVWLPNRLLGFDEGITARNVAWWLVGAVIVVAAAGRADGPRRIDR